MVAVLLEITWSQKAKNDFKKAYQYIHEVSPQNADKFRSVIVELVEKLKLNPESNPPDKFKTNNSGNYRAFEKYKYRVSYLHTDTKILILRFRSTKMKPKEY